MTKYKKIFGTVIFAYIYLMMTLFIPTNYEVTAPGVINTVSSDVIINDDKNSLDLYSISVYYKTRITPFERMIFEISNKLEVDKMSTYAKSLSNREQFLQGQISKEASYQASLIQAFMLAKEKKPEINIDYKFKGIIVYFTSENIRKDLPIGTLIKEVNHHSTYNEMIRSLRQSEYDIFSLEDGKEIKIFSNEAIRYSFYPVYEVKSNTHKIELPGLDSRTGGPSGGMMQTLYLYSNLMGYEKISQKIVGTGTIEVNGKIGKIGGALQKLYTAERYGAKYFFMAKDNYDEEIKHISKFPNMTVYRIETIEQAVNKLDEIYHELSKEIPRSN